MATLSKFQETAKRILDFPEDMNLHMASYSSKPVSELVDRKHTCGTTFCAAGFLAHLDNYPKEYRNSHNAFSYIAYSEDLIGDERDTPEFSNNWKFLFSEIWPDDLTCLKKRAAYVLEHDDVPSTNEWYKTDLISESSFDRAGGGLL